MRSIKLKMVFKKNRFQIEQKKNFELLSQKSHNRFRYFLLALLVLFSFVLGSIFYYVQDNNLLQKLGQDDNLNLDALSSIEKPKYLYYLPRNFLNPKLKQAITAYDAKEWRQASSLFQEILNDAVPDNIKATALVYLGIIAMQRDRYALARHHFLQALRYDSNHIPTIVNFAVLESRLNNYSAAREYALRARKLAPDDKQVLHLLGNILFEGKDIDQAISSYQDAIEGVSEDAWIYYNLGLSHLRKNNWETAVENFKKSIQKAKNSDIKIRAFAHLGQVYFLQGNLSLALDELHKAVRLAPENAKYLYNLGVIYLHKKDPQGAIKFFQRALAASISSPQIYRSLARAFLQLKEERYALEALSRALQSDPNHLEALFDLADLQYKLGDLEGSLRNYQKILAINPINQSYSEALRKISQVYLDSEDINSSISNLEKAIQINPKDIKSHLLLGKVYQKAKRPDLAIQIWKKVLIELPRDIVLNREEEREIRMALGRAYRKEGTFSLSFKQYKIIKTRNEEAPIIKEDPKLNIEWAKTYMSSLHYTSAISLLEEVGASRLASREQRKESFYLLSMAYKNPEQALISIRKALAYETQNEKMQFQEASLLFQTNILANREKALEILTALSYNSKDKTILSRVFNLIGKIYLENSEYQRALSAFERALELEPNFQEAYKNKQEAMRIYKNQMDL